MYSCKSKTSESNEQKKSTKFTSQFSTSQPYLSLIEQNRKDENDGAQYHHLFLQPTSIYDNHYKQQHRIIKNYSKKLNLTSSDLLDSKTNDLLNTNTTNNFNNFSQKFKSSAGSFSMSSPATTLSSTTVNSSSISASPCSFFMQNLTFNAKLLLSDVIWSQEDEPLDFRALFKSPFTSPSLSSSSHSFLFSNTNETHLPCIIKVIKNEDNELIPISCSSSSSAVTFCYTYLFLYSKIKLTHVLCQPLESTSHQVKFYSQMSIPAEYPGWFEVLSEDGKSVKPLQSIKEILNHFSLCLNIINTKNKIKNAQHSINLKTGVTGNYLVRENLNAFSLVAPSSQKKSLSASSSVLNVFNFTDLKKTLVKLGDKLTYSISDIIYVEITNELSVKLRKKMIKFTLERANVSMGSSGITTETVYIPEDSKGKFSPIARRDNISGVHQIKDLIAKFKLPITVQLVHPHALSISTLNMWNLSGKQTSISSINTSPTVFRLLKIHQIENILAYSISGQLTAQQQTIQQQQYQNLYSKILKLPSYIKLDHLKAINMYELLSSRTSSSYYLKFILNECEKYLREASDLEAIIQKSYLSLNGIKDLSELLNASSDTDAYKEIDDLYQYVRTGVLPHYLKNETLFNSIKDQSKNSSKNILENGKLAQLLKNYSNDNFIQSKSNTKKKPYVDDSLGASHHNISHTKQKKQIYVADNFLYEYASLTQSRALPAPPPKYKPAPPACFADTNSLNHTLDKIILAAKNLNSSFVASKSKSKSSNRLYFVDNVEGKDFSSTDCLKMKNESKLDLDLSLSMAPLYSISNNPTKNSDIYECDLDEMGNFINANNHNDSISCASKHKQNFTNVYSVTRNLKELPKYDYFNTILNSKYRESSNKKYVFNSIQDLNKYF